MKSGLATTVQALPNQTEEQEHDAVMRIGRAIADSQSPPGALGLGRLLDARRIKYNIPDEAFEMQAAFDRLLVWQVDSLHQEQHAEKHGVDAAGKFAGTNIYMPDTTRKGRREETPRGVIVSAGLLALDNLRSNGIDVGHIVNFIRLAPWRIPIASHAGHISHLMVLRDGDLIASEDIVGQMKRREVHIRGVEREGGGTTHVFLDANGKSWVPKEPFVDESY